MNLYRQHRQYTLIDNIHKHKAGITSMGHYSIILYNNLIILIIAHYITIATDNSYFYFFFK